MNDGMLSQDEIDALLKSTEENEQNEKSTNTLETNEYLTELEQDALGEIGNISFGSSATTLSTLLNQKVEITTPTTSIVEQSKLSDQFPHPHVGLEVKYTEGFSGVNLFVLETKDAAIIADLMLGGDGVVSTMELSDISLSAIQESMNQMMGTAATSMSQVFNKRIDISPPTARILDVAENKNNQLPKEEILVKVSFQLKVGHLIDSHIMQLIPVPFAKRLVDELVNPTSDAGLKSEQESQSDSNRSTQPTETQEKNQQSEQVESNSEPKYIGNSTPKDASIQTAAFSSFDKNRLPSKEKRNLDMLLDIPLNVTVELGQTRKSVKDILQLSSGSIIELDKLAGEPVDILINNKLIAKGEVVVIDENFGVRVSDIVSQSDRLKKLN